MKRLIISSLIILINCGYAGYILPQFSNLFFYNGKIKDIDSCNMPIYAYEFSDEKPLTIAEKIKDKLPKQEKCLWQAPKLIQEKDEVPALFPTKEEDWPKIKEQSKSVAKSQVWEFVCVDANGNFEKTLQEIIHPQYTCTPNRIDITNKQCSIKSYVCNADVVGRNLQLAGLEDIGHIGLTVDHNLKEKNTIGNYVLHATFNDDVINLDPLSKFKENSYWGEVYGLEGFDYISNDKAIKGIEAGWGQRLFNPQYTMTPYWQEGRKVNASVYNAKTQQWQVQESIIPAIFRCDTFVNYCYNKGLDIKLPKSDILSPKATYETFKYKREDIAFQKYQTTPPFQEAIEKRFEEINKDASLSKKAKQASLWSLVEQAKAAKEKNQFYYLIDRLQFENATYLIHNMIEEYLAQTDIAVKKKLQIAISQAAFTQPGQNRTSEEIEKILEAQAFFKTTMKNETNSSLLKSFAFLAPGIIPQEDL